MSGRSSRELKENKSLLQTVDEMYTHRKQGTFHTEISDLDKDAFIFLYS